jgi:hypothetical protein
LDDGGTGREAGAVDLHLAAAVAMGHHWLVKAVVVTNRLLKTT